MIRAGNEVFHDGIKYSPYLIIIKLADRKI